MGFYIGGNIKSAAGRSRGGTVEKKSEYNNTRASIYDILL